MPTVRIPLDVFQVQLTNPTITIPVQVSLADDSMTLEVFVPDRYLTIELAPVDDKVRLVIRNYGKDGGQPQVIELYQFEKVSI